MKSKARVRVTLAAGATITSSLYIPRYLSDYDVPKSHWKHALNSTKLFVPSISISTVSLHPWFPARQQLRQPGGMQYVEGRML